MHACTRARANTLRSETFFQHKCDRAKGNGFFHFLVLAVHVNLEPVHVAPPRRAVIDGGSQLVQVHLNNVQTSLQRRA